MPKIARLALFALLTAAALVPAVADDAVAWDNSGNGLLNGTYNFREVMWRNKSDLHRVAIYGTIVFDGSGGYRLTSSVFDSNSGSGNIQPFSASGAYRISASGMGFMDDPLRLNAAFASGTIWGMVSQGVFVGSTTDDGINNLFIAALAPTAAPTNASFSGGYRAMAVNFPSGDANQARNMSFPLNANGQGGLGTVNLTGFVGPGGTTITQSVSNATYSFASGVLTLAFGGSLGAQTLIAGNALCYLSADGNFFFGGSAAGFDMIVGVRAFTGAVPASALRGMYYQAGVDVEPSTGFNTLVSYYGAFTATADGDIIGHQRVLKADPALNFQPFDYTYSDVFALAADGSHDDFLGLHNVVGAGGAIRIGYAITSRLGINVALRAPDFSGPGVYLKPTGVDNAASWAPFSAGISRGGFIAVSGTNLASTTLADNRMPFTLGGVQVLINGRPAPIFFVRSDIVLAIVPFATTGTVASVQVINNNVASAIRTVRVKNGTPGFYTQKATGIGYIIATHVRGNDISQLITPQDPARPGEAILMYLTGLGDVNPSVPDGVPPPINPLSPAVIQPVLVVDGEPVTPLFAGLSPGLTGVYAITLTIPSDIAPGDVYVDIALPDSRTSEAQISIGNGGAAIQRPHARPDDQKRETIGPIPSR